MNEKEKPSWQAGPTTDNFDSASINNSIHPDGPGDKFDDGSQISDQPASHQQDTGMETHAAPAREALEDAPSVYPSAPSAPPASWKILTLRDAYAERDPLQYILDGLLPLPSLSIVYAPPGALKSFLLADLLICVAGGLSWLEQQSELPGTGYTTMQAPVMWIDLDNGERTSSERFDALGRGHNLTGKEPLYYVSMPDPWLDLSNADSVATLTEHARRLGVRLLVIDNLCDSSGSVDENSAAMRRVMSNLRRLAEDLGAAVVLIHHPRKGNGNGGRAGEMLRGHSSIEAALDLALSAYRKEGDNQVIIIATKTRFADVAPFGAQFEYEHRPGTRDLKSARFFGVPVKATTSEIYIDRAILKEVQSDPGLNRGTLVERVQNACLLVPRKSVTSAIERLTKDGRLEVSKGPRNAILHTLPKDNQECAAQPV